MPYTELQHLSAAEFKRLCGVSRNTFDEMVEVLRPHLECQGRRGGQNKLNTEDQLLVTLEYWREYRSQFHIATRDFGGNNSSRNSLTSWGLHETTVGRIIKKVEDLLINCGKFRLPSKRQLYQPGWEWKVMVVDVGEIEDANTLEVTSSVFGAHLIERPQKNRNATTLASRNATR